MRRVTANPELISPIREESFGKAASAALVTRVRDRYPKGEDASSRLRALAHRARPRRWRGNAQTLLLHLPLGQSVVTVEGDKATHRPRRASVDCGAQGESELRLSRRLRRARNEQSQSLLASWPRLRPEKRVRDRYPSGRRRFAAPGVCA